MQAYLQVINVSILIKSCEAFIPFGVKNKGKPNLFCSKIFCIILLNNKPPLVLSFNIVENDGWMSNLFVFSDNIWALHVSELGHNFTGTKGTIELLFF